MELSILPTEAVDVIQRKVLSFSLVTKHFGNTIANDSISFSIESGGIHAIVGENGAGKSTLSKILCGLYRPDRGVLLLNGTELFLNSPADAREIGIGMVHQQLALVPSLSGFENVLLGDPRTPALFGKAKLKQQVQAKAEEFGFNLNLKCSVAELGIADRQKLEIFKLLWREAQILILDEPTSQLTPFESEDILKIADSLARSGRIVILITHHINEVMTFAKRVTVLRKGKCIATCDTKDLHADELARLMVDSDATIKRNRSNTTGGASLLKIVQTSKKASDNGKALLDINLQISSGEIVGVAGISGSGQEQLGRLIAGLLDPDTGSIDFGELSQPGKSRSYTAYKRWARTNVCYIPSEQKHAYAPGLSVAANSFIRRVNSKDALLLGFVRMAKMNQEAARIIGSFSITPTYADIPALALSGGNLQRLIIGRELATAARIVVADNPCAGLDAAMASRVQNELGKCAEVGRAVLLISPDLEELIAVCDRIVVMFNGRINGEVKAPDFDYNSLALMIGGKASATGPLPAGISVSAIEEAIA